MREIDLLEKLKAFDDTMEIVQQLKGGGWEAHAKHLHELWTVSKHLATEVRRLRKKESSSETN
jgi:hypothetical protein